MAEGTLDVLQLVDYIRGLNQERTAKKAVRGAPQLLGMEGPATGPIDPAIFTNPAFLRALAARTGQLDAETARGFTGAQTGLVRQQTSGLQQQEQQERADVERLGGVSVPAFSAVTDRRNAIGPEERGLNRDLATRGVVNEEAKVKLLQDNMTNEATQKFVESLLPLAQILGGKDASGLMSGLLSTIKSGPYAGVGQVLGQREAERKKLLQGVLGAGTTPTAPGEAPIAPGNVFSSPAFQAAFQRYAQANNLYLPGSSPENLRVGAMFGGAAPGVPQLQTAKQPTDVTSAAKSTQQKILELLGQRGRTPQTPAEEKSFAASQAPLSQLSTDYQTFVDAARSLGVQDLEQFNQLMLQLQELGMVPKAR